MTVRLGSATLCVPNRAQSLLYTSNLSFLQFCLWRQSNSTLFPSVTSDFVLKQYVRSISRNLKKKNKTSCLCISVTALKKKQFPVCLQTVRYESRCAAVLTWRHVSWSWTLGCRGASRGKLAPSQREESPAPECDSRNQRGQEGKQNNNAVVSGVFQIAQIHTVNPSHTMWLTGTCLWWGVWACRWIYEALTPC